ncbi:hypothetical protein DFR86_11255 [Acidianus sulfidivorans JP7]|uniref:Uncharacterized protein n=1 Tax=Acidianus sulfidivorans JP7 TaxID=619593 RepID=A0A2U9IQ03_9CREN|nr:hypothetical protein [Acidianus sulfidivorans]AWR98054.1 hypothetical protein DFR86_11255 [Acidianus sulfidivorans JP7]
MCDYRLVRINRSISKVKNIVLVPRDLFNKFTTDEAYFKVLVSDNREELPISKSYYYYILSQLKDSQLLNENAISFKAAIPVIITERGIEFDNSMMFIDDQNKTLYFIDTKSTKYECPSCPMYTECVYGLKRVAREMGIKVGNIDENGRFERLPSKLWNIVINNILVKHLNKLQSIKIPLTV